MSNAAELIKLRKPEVFETCLRQGDAPSLMLSFKFLAGELGVSLSTLYKWARNEEMPAPVKIGERSMFIAADIRAWLEEDCPPCPPASADERRKARLAIIGEAVRLWRAGERW